MDRYSFSQSQNTIPTKATSKLTPLKDKDRYLEKIKESLKKVNYNSFMPSRQQVLDSTNNDLPDVTSQTNI